MATIGILCVTYRNTGSQPSPVWVAVPPEISEWAVKPTWDKGDAPTRASRVKRTAKTMLGVTITGKIRVITDNANYLAFLAALNSDSPLDLLILNGALDASPASKGYRGDFHVFGGEESQGPGDVLYMSVELEVALSVNPFYKASNTTFTVI